MRLITKFQIRFKGLIDSVARYPLTTVFLIAAAIIMAIGINQDKSYSKLLFTCAIGAACTITSQSVYERYFYKAAARIVLLLCSACLTAAYYFIINTSPDVNMHITVKTCAVLSALIIAYIFIPTIKTKISFEDSFMAFFKAFFLSLLYSAAIMVGCSAIIAAISSLIYQLSPHVYAYATAFIFILFAVLFFLSLIPKYKIQNDTDVLSDEVLKATHVPKFLEVLLSYIIIPMVSVYTLILIVYIILNIGKDFWSNSLIEPLLVTYAIAVILIYILTCGLENKFAKIFRTVFSKTLIAIVLFQLISTVINLKFTGFTIDRYYVISLGIFSVIAGMVMCFNTKRNGIIAATFILFCIISVMPPIDSFTVSKVSQTNRLQAVLIKNEMLKDNKITPKNSIPENDKSIIINSVRQLNMMDHTQKIEWLGQDFTMHEDFETIFGFNEYDLPDKTDKYIMVFLSEEASVDIKGYDVMVNSFINNHDKDSERLITVYNEGKSYVLTNKKLVNQYDIILTDSDEKELIKFNADEILERYMDWTTTDKSGITEKDASFYAENEKMKTKIIIKSVNINKDPNETYFNADFYMLIKFK